VFPRRARPPARQVNEGGWHGGPGQKLAPLRTRCKPLTPKTFAGNDTARKERIPEASPARTKANPLVVVLRSMVKAALRPAFCARRPRSVATIRLGSRPERLFAAAPSP
jgi:hypothetical protein